MRDRASFWKSVRISWPVLGGLWGGWLGFGGYPQLLQNADSFALVFALGFYIFFGCIGLVAGMAAGALTGGLVEWLLRRLGMGIAVAVTAATLVSALVLWQIAGLIQAKYPGLRSSAAVHPGTPVTEPHRNPCANPPPAHSREGELWNSECR